LPARTLAGFNPPSVHHPVYIAIFQFN